MIHDKKLLGVCGETELANAKTIVDYHDAGTWDDVLPMTGC